MILKHSKSHIHTCWIQTPVIPGHDLSAFLSLFNYICSTKLNKTTSQPSVLFQPAQLALSQAMAPRLEVASARCYTLARKQNACSGVEKKRA